jgi:hypothetical protein
VHEAGRAARLHPAVPVFVLASDGAGTSDAIFDLLRPFQRSLLVDGEVPSDAWTRVARHWHECFRLRHPAVPGDWVVEGYGGERWLVTDEQFRRTYRAVNGHLACSAGASSAQARS